ncbi:hypothetical protein SAMN06266787_10541 [Halorubrum ezzemoulense]|uniref:Uncharacterized protein n=1 Tax=Halorubrum ezzemoulense TaxID=337243 RepID=A0A238XJL9_HALEZ|nr:hypothetical protein [Halorubrum ezzemoulense]SNR58149.1 hypothetical protein SAMN06266787_10541 [Halorubrum ezzemoulense]
MRIQNTGPKTEYYALFSAAVVFTAGWAVSIILIEEGSISNIPRWRSTLWYYLTNHGIPLSEAYNTQSSVGVSSPLLAAEEPSIVRTIPVAATVVAGAYTSYQKSTHHIKTAATDALTAGSAYFLIALSATVLTDIQPQLSSLLLIGGLIAGAAWVGSSFLSTFTRNIPIIGVASLGTILALGFILIAGSAAIISILWELLAISYIGAAIGGVGVGAEKAIRRRGKRRQTNTPRLTGTKILLKENLTEIIVVVGVAILLYAALTGAV